MTTTITIEKLILDLEEKEGTTEPGDALELIYIEKAHLLGELNRRNKRMREEKAKQTIRALCKGLSYEACFDLGVALGGGDEEDRACQQAVKDYLMERFPLNYMESQRILEIETQKYLTYVDLKEHSEETWNKYVEEMEAAHAHEVNLVHAIAERKEWLAVLREKAEERRNAAKT